MRISPGMVFGLLLLLLWAPEPAYAWGPGFHISTASNVLNLVLTLPPALGILLSRHRGAFLYGNIAADLVFAKRLSRIKQFCHHWATGFKLLADAPDERSQVLAYGYLSHLAADTVAHGKYIPHQVLEGEAKVSLGHFYWELRADQAVSRATWKELKAVLAQNHETDYRMLAQHLSPALLPFPMNRLLFERINALASGRMVRQAVGGLSRASRRELPPGLLPRYQEECVDRILSILREGERSPVVREDPSGTSALMQVAVRRRELRSLRRRGLPIGHRLRENRRNFAPSQPLPAELDGIQLDDSGLAYWYGTAP